MIFNMVGGGGGGLNFEVVGGTTQPTSPKGNTIWVNTSTAITSWVFSVEQPTSPAAGMVWIAVGATSQAKFNAASKNVLMVYPQTAKQYISDSWVSKTMNIYINGSWENGMVYIVQDGTISSVYGLSGRLRQNSGFSVAQKTGYVQISTSVTTSDGFAPASAIDITGYSKVTLYCNVLNAGVEKNVGVGLSKALNASDYETWWSNIVASKSTSLTGVQTLVCDISSLNGKYYPCIFADAGEYGKPNIYVYDFYLS